MGVCEGSGGEFCMAEAMKTGKPYQTRLDPPPDAEGRPLPGYTLCFIFGSRCRAVLFQSRMSQGTPLAVSCSIKWKTAA